MFMSNIMSFTATVDSFSFTTAHVHVNTLNCCSEDISRILSDSSNHLDK